MSEVFTHWHNSRDFQGQAHCKQIISMVTFGHEPALRAAVPLGHHLPGHLVHLALEVVVRHGLVVGRHTNEVWPTWLRGSAGVRSAKTKHY